MWLFDQKFRLERMPLLDGPATALRGWSSDGELVGSGPEVRTTMHQRPCLTLRYR